ncbi:hypothetical protein [Chryseobacterium oryctis]|uniref:DUF5017 domain-containing protein n=1 Tax=Chryseobacterium oryctis TaxID=2952618 RepID=A0ABT3HKC4_9FLAO|nr:hypothetical protein [Chryseobacterium oryctis]MCW3160217.1 hypothetical protein [Chryseobacterium oryctis]
MKKFKLFFLIMFYNLCSAQQGNVGINTPNPEEKLHINGNLQVDDLHIENDFSKLDTNEKYTFLIKSPSPDNKITSYNYLTDTQDTAATLNFIQFKIDTDDSDGDWINEFDTKINASKYIVVISSFGFNLPVFNSSDTKYTPVPQIFAKINPTTNTWVLKADYDSFKPNETGGQWTLNLLAFDRSQANLMAHVNVNMNNNETKSATTPLLQ